VEFESATSNERIDLEAREALRSLWWTGLSIFLLVVGALALSSLKGVLGALGIGLLIVFTAAAVGAVLGFLFAIPRILSTDPKIESPAGAGTNPVTGKRRLASNTNLDRVSDWLTTMIVGVGLSQITQVNSSLIEFRNFIAMTVKPCEAGACALPGISPMLLIFGLVGGFISFYLFTRLKLSKPFQEVERQFDPPLAAADAAIVKEVAKVVSKEKGEGENPAVQTVLASEQPSVDESLGLMLSLLYREGGYQRVIDIGGQLSNSVASRRADFWFYLAAAFGQKHKALTRSEASSEERRSARDNALDCARRAVELDFTYKPRLLNLSDPEGMDDDLSDFRDDPDFVKIVGARYGHRRGSST